MQHSQEHTGRYSERKCLINLLVQPETLSACLYLLAGGMNFKKNPVKFLTPFPALSQRGRSPLPDKAFPPWGNWKGGLLKLRYGT